MLKKIITWAIVIFLGFYLITQPDGAAGVINGWLHLIMHASTTLRNFLNSL